MANKIPQSDRTKAEKIGHPRNGKTYGLKNDNFEEIKSLISEDNNWTGENTYDLPINFDYDIPSVDGTAGSGNIIKKGFSFSKITDSDSNYPATGGVVAVYKFNDNRTVQTFTDTSNGDFYTRPLHSSSPNVWHLHTKTDANNVFSGINLFNQAPKSDVNATVSNELVRFVQLANYVDRTTAQIVGGKKTFEQPLLSSYATPDASGLGGSGNSIAEGISVVMIVGDGLTRDYPLSNGTCLTIKSANHRTFQMFCGTNSPAEIYVRPLHVSTDNVWTQLGGGGGGDVTQAGDNDFTGENDFENAPTSQEDASSANELVRFGQLSSFVDSSSGSFTPTLSASGLTYTLGTVIGSYYKMGQMVYVNIYVQITSTSGSPSSNQPVKIGGLPFDSLTSLDVLNIGRFENSSYSDAELNKKTAFVVTGLGTEVWIADIDESLSPTACTFTDGLIIISGSYITS